MNKEENDILDASLIARLKSMASTTDPSFFKDVVTMFADQAPGIIREMDESCKANQYQQMGEAAHKLKGSALNIGAKRLAEVCRTIEISGRSGDGKDCTAMIASVKGIYERTMEELKKLI